MPKKLSLSLTHTHTHTHTLTLMMESHFSRSFLSRSTSSASLIVPTHQQRAGSQCVGVGPPLRGLQVSDLPFCAGFFLWLCCSSKGWFAQGETVSQPYRRRESVPERDCVRMCAQHALPGVPARTMCAAQLAPHGSTLRWTCPLPGASAQPATPPCWLH